MQGDEILLRYTQDYTKNRERNSRKKKARKKDSNDISYILYYCYISNTIFHLNEKSCFAVFASAES